MKIKFVQKRLFLCIIAFAVLAFGEESSSPVTFLNNPNVQADFAIGFNYDYLRSPFSRSFERSKGYFGVAIPVGMGVPQEMLSGVIEPMKEFFPNAETFAPELSFKQFANTTVEVQIHDMLGGATSFSHLRMMDFAYDNEISISNILIPTPEGQEDALSLIMRGALSVPLGVQMSWETMNFGYTYRFFDDNKSLKDKIKVSLDMHHHSFLFNAYGNIDVDIAGNIDVEMISMHPEYSLHNSITGNYALENWTPTVGLELWGASVIANFGFEDSAKGSINGKYVLPFFVDPNNFQLDEALTNGNQDSMITYVLNHQKDFNDNVTVETNLSTDNDLYWSMPTALTFGYGINNNMLSISYTKLIGNLGLSLIDTTIVTDTASAVKINLDFSAKIDHIVTLSGNFSNGFINLGVFALNVDVGEEKNLLTGIENMIPYGEGVLVPILNFGVAIGGDLQLLLEADIAPFPAIKSGIVYHF